MLGRKTKIFRFKSDPCHHGNVHVFTAEYNGRTLMFYGGGEMRGFNPESVDVTITFVNPYVEMSNLYTIDSEPKYIYLPVPDMGAPTYPLSFWYHLLDKIIENIPLDVIKIGVMCLGGHGRTGTALAIFAWMLKETNKPIRFVRKNYCKNAVETTEQIKYIQELTGTHEKVKGTKEDFSYYFTRKYYQDEGEESIKEWWY